MLLSKATTSSARLSALVATALLTGCLERELAPLNPCLVSGVTVQVVANNIDKVDLLFMVDNSSSMEDKQKNLRLHVPQLVQTLVTGMRSPNDPHPFPPVKDLHISVVDSDMGLVGVTGIIGGCSGTVGTAGSIGFGDDGLFQHTPHPSPESPTCDATYPTFLSYVANSAAGPSAAKLEQDFGCVANVGATGCGFEQQLEATLKSLWPAQYADPKTGKPASNPYTFLTDAAHPQEALGHGDGANAGFQRNDPTTGTSLLAIIVLSDEDDGSTGDMGLYAPSASAPSWIEPITKDNLNLRPLIGSNRNHLYPISRYVDAFKALRPKNPLLVVYAAITGVPLDLVDDNATANVNFSKQAERDAYYDNILNDPRMQNTVDNSGKAGELKVKYACDTTFGHANPGRRYVELAKGMGESATIYSICQDDYTPAMNRIIDIIAKQLSNVCLPRPLVRNSLGKVDCNVVWELPAPGAAHSIETPTSCSDRPYLAPADPGRVTLGDNHGILCRVNQLAVSKAEQVAPGDGWFYDNSDEAKRSCNVATPQRVTFTASAKPPTGVTVKLECLNETQHVVSTRNDVAPGVVPSTIGTPCEVASTTGTTSSQNPDNLCAVQLASGQVDRSMFCHPKTNTCVLACASPNECPAAWVCDTRPATLADTASATRPMGSGICVNPTCGTN